MGDQPLEPITHRRVLKIAVPILLANITVPILGAVDTAVVGQIPQAEPIAAVGVGAVILSAIYWVFGFLRMGTAGLTAQAAGQGDQAEVAALLTRALLIGVAGGVLVLALQALLFRAALTASPAGPEVEALALAYMATRVWSAPAAIALYGVTGWLIARERTRDVLFLQLWINGVNIALDFAFVIGLGWGVEGVAWATVLAEWTGLCLGLMLCRAIFRETAWRNWGRVFDRAKLRRMAAVNSDILIRSLFLQAIFVSFLLLGGRFGAVTLAANQVLLQFMHIMSYALDGFAFAAEALVGQAMGARQAHRIRRAALMTSVWGLGCTVLFAVGFALFGGALIDVISKDPQVQSAARAFLPWIICAPILALGSYMLDGVFIGATRTADMRNMMILSAAIYFAAVALLIGPLGNHGLWLALMISLIARAVTLGLRYPALEQSAAQSR